jgi:hypothetical protein
MTMGRFRAICGYLRKYPDATMRFRTKIHVYFDLQHVTFYWCYSVYGGSKEELPHDMPTSTGKPVCTTTFEDANRHA